MDDCKLYPNKKFQSDEEKQKQNERSQNRDLKNKQKEGN